MDDLATAIAEGTSIARLRALLDAELDRGGLELARKRSGYEQPVLVAVAGADGALRAVAPATPALRADPDAVNERTWLLVAALVGALVEVAGAAACAPGVSASSWRSTSPAIPRTPTSCPWPSRATLRASTGCGRAR